MQENFEWKDFSYGTCSRCIFSICGKTLEGSIVSNSRATNKYTFTMQSLGISNNKLKVDNLEEAKREAEKTILKKVNLRINEFSAMKRLLEK